MSNKNNLDVGISPLACSTFSNCLQVFRELPVDREYYGRMIGVLLLSILNEPFHWWEEIRYGRAIQHTPLPENPLFILGHWRSGTTFLHNLICQDPQFAYITTYQSVFPNQLHGSKWLFKNIMYAFLPEKRPADNMKLDPDFPQEEEIALGNMMPYSFYHFLYFPRNTFELYEKYIRFHGVSDQVQQRWASTYKKLIKSCLLYHRKKEFVSKSPPNTARIKPLLQLFPGAKFIYIYRNPITVFFSASRFFRNVFPPICFQKISPDAIDELILNLYPLLIQDYENNKNLIPPGQLVEIRYEDFEKQPIDMLSYIYTTISLKGFDTALPHFRCYVSEQHKHEKYNYQTSKATLDKIMHHWNFAMELYGYSIPAEMQVI